VSDEVFIEYQGGTYSGPRSELAGALKRGAKEISRVDYEASKQGLRAGAEGVARSVTLGVSDWALREGLDVPREELEARAKTDAAAAGEGDGGCGSS
jgi:hypothetical protein